MNIGRFSLNNTVLITISLVAMLTLGVISYNKLPQEMFPDISFSWAFVVVPYPGVSAEDVEKSVTVKIENEIADLDKVKKITSVSREGVSFVQVEFEDNVSKTEMKTLLQDLRGEVDKVDLPEDALDPQIDEFSTADFMPIITINMGGKKSPQEMNEISRELKDRIERVRDISKAEIVGGRKREVWIETDKTKLESFGISLDEIAGAIRARHLNIPAGKVTTPEGKYLLRTLGEIEAKEDFGSVIVRQVPGRGAVSVSDVAKIGNGLAQSDYDVRDNGAEALSILVSKTSRGNSIEVVDEVKKIIKEFETRYKGELKFTLSGDTTVQIRDTMKSLGANALGGIICVVLTIFVFLGFRNSIIIAIGIPTTFAVTFLFMEQTGQTLNGNSLFGLVMVLGMLVDHAIVMIENIYRYKQNGFDSDKAAELGTNEVVWPVIASAGTTIAAFLPLMLLTGIMGKFMRIIPLVVCTALAISVVIALLYIPQMAHRLGSSPKEDHHLLVKLQEWFRGLMRTLFRHRYKTFILSSLVVVLSLFGFSAIKMELFAGEALSRFQINITLPRGADRSETNAVVKKYEEKILPLVGTKEYTGLNTTVGFQVTESEWLTEDNVAQMTVLLKEKSEGRERAVTVVRDEIKALCATIPGADEVTFDIEQGGPPVDKPVSLRILGDDLNQLADVADKIKAKIATYEPKGIYNITDNVERNSPELVVRVNEPLAREYGLSVAQIGMALRNGVEGIKAATYFDNDEEIDVLVRFAEADKNKLESFTSLKFTTPQGTQIPFAAVCTISEENGVAKILRTNRSREVKVEADAKDKMIVQKEVNPELVKWFETEIAPAYPTISLSTEGEFAEFARMMSDILALLFVGVFAIYMILGAQFKSFLQPLIILFTVPFALMGVVIYLLISGTALNLTVMFALAALVGTSVNASIVLISFINNRRRVDLMSTEDAVVDAAVVRMRPIMLTTITTMIGLVPMALGGNETWAPMASTMVAGLIVAVIGTFTVIPSVYGILDDITNKLGFKMKLEGE